MKYIIGAVLIWNLITFLMMGLDKYFAKKEKRRIAETTLIGSAFVLGGIGTFIGMYAFRHKTKTAKFLILVPLSIVINIVAFVGLYTIFSPK